ncbi:MAG: pantoate--beta-alanine ligase [Gammaproteobacteria bacterium]
MQFYKTIPELREALSSIRQAGKSIGLVPTMGNLHEGHLSLVSIARDNVDVVVVTLFVNPSQFVEGEDFDAYPRTPDADLKKLKEMQVDIVFMPDVTEIYPVGINTEVTVPALDSIFCGETRPGHFKGVATVVTKLFNIVQADVAVFGEKDYQQLLVIRRLVEDLNIPIHIIGAPTVRESNGLAMSSRNQYLSADERKQAAKLYQCLQKMAAAIKRGDKNYDALEQQSLQELTDAGFKPDYVRILDANTLKSPPREKIVIIAAAWLGRARLIDNVAVQTYD